ncbi:MAG: hypothetical protein EOO17_04940 [Chloroflexi bacterium]|nr:MAG: hypothetical protein EOO17_04940 [Chloroflexota bacterium]
MKIPTYFTNISVDSLRSLANRYTLIALIAVLTLSSAGVVFFSQETDAQAPKSCNVYKEKLYEACVDGYNGGVCEFWLTTDDEAHQKACDDGATIKNNTSDTPDTDNGGESDGEEPVEPGRNQSNSEGGKKDQLQQQIDKLRELSKDANGESKPDEIKDNNFGQYVNGAGKLQQITVRNSRTNAPAQPAIIFFNGGGWISNDGTGAKVAPKANERGYTTFEATYRLGSSGVYYQLEDVMRAVKHVRDNSAMYGIDPNRIAIWGDSAGGSLVTRAAGTGKSGAAATVGWSAPTNAYTALFHSPQSFAIGMVHSTCAPTDINGAIDTINQLNGGEAADPKELHDGGVGNFGTNGTDDALGTVISVLELAQKAQETGKKTEEISKQIESDNAATDTGSTSGSGSGQGENVRRLASKKVIECIDNFNTLSPALFASGLTPPMFLAGYDGDPLVHPGQAYQMRDKLRSMGIQSEALILPGPKHLGFEEEMVKPSLDFLERFLRPVPVAKTEG